MCKVTNISVYILLAHFYIIFEMKRCSVLSIDSVLSALKVQGAKAPCRITSLTPFGISKRNNTFEQKTV